ncbi:MAG: hypothetical protein R3195_13835 [Gemmatimonadota bacterium]|nr:hypothetical protein [Gemmatimonadota bacterium]
MNRRTLIATLGGLFAIVALASLSHATPRTTTGTPGVATLTGTWVITIETPEGAMENTWQLEQAEDNSLSGVTMSDMIGEVPFEGGWVDGDAFGFAMYVDYQGQGFDVAYEGTFTETEMAGVLDAGGGQFVADFTGVRVEGGAR